MVEPRKACVVLIENEDGSFEVMDASGQVLSAKSTEELGAACASVLKRDDLPEVTTPSPLQVHMEEAASRAAEYIGRKGSAKARALAPLIAPAIKGVSNAAARLRQKHDANDRQKTRDAEQRQTRAQNRRRLMQLRGGTA